MISDTVIQQCQMKIMTTNRESDIERFNLLYDISISEVYWRDLVACIHVSEADSDKSTWVFFFFNCRNKLPQRTAKMYSKFKMESAISLLLNYWSITVSIQKVFLKCRKRGILHKNN